MPIKLHIHDDNSITIIGEETYISSPTNGNDSYSHTDLHFIKLNADHEIEWVKNKYNSIGSIHPDLSKTGTFVIDNKVHFVHFSYTQKDMLLSSIDQSGNFSSLSLGSTYDKERIAISRFYFNAASYTLFDNKELLFTTHRREEYKLTKIIFKEK